MEEENKKRAMFPGETIAGIFSNVKSLYQLHHDFLLPKLAERIGSWEKDPRIGMDAACVKCKEHLYSACI